MRRFLLSSGLLLAALTAQAQTCEAVATVNQDFSNFTAGSSQPLIDCWSKIAPGYPNGLVYPDATGDNKYAVYYGGEGTGAFSYLIGPEVSTFDGAHQLSFSTWKLAQGGQVPAGTVTITAGTITNVTDGGTFVPYTDPITVDSATPATFDNIVIPSAPAGSHLAWRFSTTNQHNAVAIDNVVWDAVPCPAVATFTEDFANFTATTTFPYNCWETNAGTPPSGPMIYVNTPGSVTYYAGSNNTTPAYLITPKVSTMDGAHKLDFDATVSGANGIVTLQLGYYAEGSQAFTTVGDPMMITASNSTFRNIVFPTIQTNARIAFRFTSVAPHQAVAIDNVSWSEVTVEECPAVETFTEDFANFTAETTFPYNCWETNAGTPPSGPMIYVNTPGSVTYYAGSNNTTPAYLITPKVSTMDGAHKLDFTATVAGANGIVTLQLGYYAEGSQTFTTVGQPMMITAANSTFSNIVFPAIQENARIAFRFTSVAPHQAVAIDNVSWTPVTNSNDNFAKKGFTLYPNPAAGSVNLVNNANAEGTVNIYSLTGAQVFSAKIGTGEQNLNLSGLQSGMYLVKVQTGNAVSTQKLVIQ
jgi:hypothetical protein